MISTAAVKRQRGVIGKTHYECPICGSRHLEYEFIVERAPVCACQDCGLLFLSPQPEEPSAAESLEQTSELDEISEAKAAERLRQLIAYSGLGGGRLLLIGAKSQLVNEARKMGFEISAVTTSEFESTPLDRLGCDMDACILMSLETAKDPLKVLQSVRCVLKKTGSLMLVAPTIDSQAAKLFRASWWEFGRKNLFYFSVDTLQIC